MNLKTVVLSEISQAKESIYWISEVLTNANSCVLTESKVVAAWGKGAGDAGGRNDKGAQILFLRGRRIYVRHLDYGEYISHGYV